MQRRQGNVEITGVIGGADTEHLLLIRARVPQDLGQRLMKAGTADDGKEILTGAVAGEQTEELFRRVIE